MPDPHDVPVSKSDGYAPLRGEGPVASNIVHDGHVFDYGNQVIDSSGDKASGTTGVGAVDPVTGARYPIGQTPPPWQREPGSTPAPQTTPVTQVWD